MKKIARDISLLFIAGAACVWASSFMVAHAHNIDEPTPAYIFHKKTLENALFHTHNIPIKDILALHRKAEHGDAKSQYDLALSYLTGNGIPKDYTGALKWLRKSSEQGYTEAQLMLGYVLYYGVGTPKDEVGAVKWI